MGLYPGDFLKYHRAVGGWGFRVGFYGIADGQFLSNKNKICTKAVYERENNMLS